MALFGKKQQIKKAGASPARGEVGASFGTLPKQAGEILRAPRITEKSANVTEQNVFVFNVAKRSGKREVAQAVEALYKVKPRKVHVVNIPGKVNVSRATNRKGRSASERKAYVYLKKGDTIELA